MLLWVPCLVLLCSVSYLQLCVRSNQIQRELYSARSVRINIWNYKDTLPTIFKLVKYLLRRYCKVSRDRTVFTMYRYYLILKELINFTKSVQSTAAVSVCLFLRVCPHDLSRDNIVSHIDVGHIYCVHTQAATKNILYLFLFICVWKIYLQTTV
jgi:hypothetical protein